MDFLELKNYCLVLLGIDNEPIEDILRISESTPNTMCYKSQDVIIATFSSYLNLQEITEYVKSYDVNFLINEINESFNKNFIDDNINHELFGSNFAKQNNNQYDYADFDNIASEFLNNKCNYNNSYVNYEIMYDFNDDKDIQKCIDTILDKGYDNMTEYDKKLIQKLTNK